MRIHILHDTVYHYSEPVYLEPHVLRFTPCSRPWFSVVDSSITVRPDPAGFSPGLDADGNTIHVVWFNELVSTLEVHASMTVDVDTMNPYQFMVFPASGLKLPMEYSTGIQDLLAASRASRGEESEIQGYARQLAEEAGWQTVPFLSLMVQRIHQDFAYQYRRFGDIHSPVQTWRERRGSCRDLVVLAMDVCRFLGFASRFVTGYYLDDELKEHAELHAWMEVYIPGAGWREFDPTNGVACYGRHVALASSAYPSLTASVTGSYRGLAQSSMDSHMVFQEVCAADPSSS
jgi:transglutaminase-like putative cysteine protease